MTGVRSNVALAEARAWELHVENGATPQAVAAGVIGTMAQLDEGLSRWIGTGGYCTLFRRALSCTEAEFPWLAPFPCPRGDKAMLTAAAETVGSAAVVTGINAFISNLVDMLGRIIGPEMAMRLVEQACMPNPRELVEPDTEH